MNPNAVLLAQLEGLKSIDPSAPSGKVGGLWFSNFVVILGIGLALGTVLVLWAWFYVKRKQRRRQRHHTHHAHRAHHQPANPAPDPEDPGPDAQPSVEDGSGERRHRRRRTRRRRNERPRNPTLAQTGGLPPPRPDDSSASLS